MTLNGKCWDKKRKKINLIFFFSKNGRVRWHEMRLKQPWCVKKWSFKNTTEKYISLLDFFHSSSSLVVWPVFGSLFQRFLNWHRTIFDVRAKSVSLARSEQKKKKEKNDKCVNIEVRFRTFIFGRFSYENFHFSISSFLANCFIKILTEVKKKESDTKKIVAKNISRVRHATNEKKNKDRSDFFLCVCL